jgi:signal transduction histidine kinase
MDRMTQRTATSKSLGLIDLYASGLEEYLAHRDEAGLKRAYELGRLGVAAGIGILDLAMVHHEALVGVLQRARTSADADDAVSAAADFFLESLSPYEMTHRGFRESAIALRRLYEGLEAEIKRIAHTVHDDVAQLLASLCLAMAELESALAPSASPAFGKVATILGQLETHLRRLPHELRPTALDDLGLTHALQFLAQGVSLRNGISVSVECTLRPARARLQGDARERVASTTRSALPEDGLPLVIETAIYRIVQEALTNVGKHARASQATVRVWQETHGLRCIVHDNGSGFDVSAVRARRGSDRGLGLIGIQERVAALGGTLQIDARVGKGTRLDIAIPIEASHVTRYPAGR